MELGETDQAKTNFKTALIINPNSIEAHRHLSILSKYEEGDEHLSQMLEIHRKDQLSRSDASQLNFALAKAFDDIGDCDRAFAHLQLGNDIRHKTLGYQISQDRELFNKLYTIQRGIEPINERNIQKNNVRQIFIVGMPRSGTTLVEQIISSHSEVAAWGELAYIQGYVKQIIEKNINVDREVLLRIRQFYLKKMAKLLVAKASLPLKCQLIFALYL